MIEKVKKFEKLIDEIRNDLFGDKVIVSVSYHYLPEYVLVSFFWDIDEERRTVDLCDGLKVQIANSLIDDIKVYRAIEKLEKECIVNRHEIYLDMVELIGRLNEINKEEVELEKRLNQLKNSKSKIIKELEEKGIEYKEAFSDE